MLLQKNIPLSDVCLKMEGDSGTFEGYASVFGGVDVVGDTILKGAFDYTLRTNGQPKLFLEHAWTTFGANGSATLPIGKCTCKEDDHGLFLRGELTPGMSVATDVRAAMKHGTIDGLSIGGFIKKGDYDETESGRVIRRWSKLLEVSVVSMPADNAARINASSVKSADVLEAIEHIDTTRDLESFLRDAGGLSKGAAVALLARAKSVLFQGEPEPAAAEAKALADLATRVQRMSESIRV